MTATKWWAGDGFSQSAVKLTIHADTPTTPKVSPTLYGLMTEEINYSYEGGLYAELVQDSTFLNDWRSGELDSGGAGDGAAKLAQDRTTGPSAALPAA
jgi:alpha-L-arabinofuranosidase